MWVAAVRCYLSFDPAPDGIAAAASVRSVSRPNRQICDLLHYRPTAKSSQFFCAGSPHVLRRSIATLNLL